MSGKRPFRPRKSPLQTAGGLSGLGKGPCILQEGFSTLKKVPAIRKKAFQPSKTPLQSAWTFSAAISDANSVAGPTPGAENGKISVET